MLSKLLRRSVKRLVEGEKEYGRIQAAMTDLIIRASGGKPPESLLDVGCGEGGYTRQNAEALGLALDRVHGVDFNPSHLEVAEAELFDRASRSRARQVAFLKRGVRARRL